MKTLRFQEKSDWFFFSSPALFAVLAVTLPLAQRSHGQSGWLEGWQASTCRAYVPQESGPVLIRGDRGQWDLGDTASECEPSPNTAEIICNGTNKQLKLTTAPSTEGCAENMWVALFSTSIAISPTTVLSVSESGSLSNPYWNGSFPSLFPPPGDNIHLWFRDNRGNFLVYLFQRAGNYVAHTTTFPTQAGSVGYHEILLDAANAPGGTYVRNVFNDFSQVPGFSSNSATIAEIKFEITAVGTATLDDLRIGPAVNTPPTISDVSNQTINEDTPTAALPVNIGDVETALNSLTLTASSSNTTLVPTANIVFSGTGANRFVTITPAANRSGSATITVTVGDGAATVNDTFTLTVTAVNDAPTISDIADRSTNEDTATTAIPFVIGDVETSANSLTVTRASSSTTLVPLAGIVLGGSGANRTVTVTPAANQSGSATITLTVSDGTLTQSDSFVLTVNPVNDVPTISNISNLSTSEDTPTNAIAFTVGDPETPADTLTVTGSSTNATLVPLTGFGFGGSGSSRTVIVSPALNQSGTSTITVTVSDGTATASDTFVLTVNAVNDAPVITDLPDLMLIRNTAPAPIAFTIGDVETAATSLTVTRASSNTTLLPNSAVVLGGSGANRTVTLTPAANQIGSSVITLTVSDGNKSTSDTFTVTVTNLTPLAAWKEAQFGADANNEAVAGDLADPDGDRLVNLIEYALGGNPNSAASAPYPVISVINERMCLTFNRIVANTDVTISIKAADSLDGPWTDLAQSAGGNAVTVLAAGATVSETGTGATRSVEVCDLYTLDDPLHPSRFLRLMAGH